MDNIEDNIYTIKSAGKKLSDEDIDCLIMGIVGLIRKSTAYNVHEKYKSIVDDYENRLNQTIVELKKKDELLMEVMIENEKLKGGGKSIDKLLEEVNRK